LAVALCAVFTASSGRVQNGLTSSDANRSIAGSSWSSGRATTQFDFPETLMEESSVETIVDATIKVC